MAGGHICRIGFCRFIGISIEVNKLPFSAKLDAGLCSLCSLCRDETAPCQPFSLCVGEAPEAFANKQTGCHSRLSHRAHAAQRRAFAVVLARYRPTAKEPVRHYGLHHVSEPDLGPKVSKPLIGWIGLACCAIAAPGAVLAQPLAQPLQPQTSAAAAPETERAVIENTRQNARIAAEWLARRVDSWFGDKPFEDGGSVSNGRLSISVFKRADQSADVDVRFDARFRLPNVERSAYLFIGRDDPREAIRDTPGTRTSQQQLQSGRAEDRSFLAGLGFSLLRDVDIRVGLSANLKPYVQARYTKPWGLTPDQSLVFRETVFLTQNDHLGSTTALSYEWRLKPGLDLRWVNAASITQVSKNFEWSSTLGAYKTFGPQQVLGLEGQVSGTGTQGTGVGRSDYGVLGRWEQPVYKDWLLGEVVAGHFWPRPDSSSPRGRAWALGGSLKMRF